MSLRRFITFTTLFLSLLIASSAQAALHAHQRDGWFIGLAAGGASAALTSDGESSDREFGSSGAVRAGYVIHPRVALAFDGGIWFKTIDDVDWTLGTYTAGAMFYPGDGWLLRLGAGAGDAEAAVQQGATTVTASESGFGLSGGLGYEIRVGRTWAIVPELDAAYINVDSFDANIFGFGVGVHWYFIPR